MVTKYDLYCFHLVCAAELTRAYDWRGMKTQLYMHPEKYRAWTELKRKAARFITEMERED